VLKAQTNSLEHSAPPNDPENFESLGNSGGQIAE
jgi:hypothetical protein